MNVNSSSGTKFFVRVEYVVEGGGDCGRGVKTDVKVGRLAADHEAGSLEMT